MSSTLLILVLDEGLGSGDRAVRCLGRPMRAVESLCNSETRCGYFSDGEGSQMGGISELIVLFQFLIEKTALMTKTPSRLLEALLKRRFF